MKPANRGPILRTACLIILAILMVIGSAFMVAVHRQVQENRHKLAAEFAGFVNFSAPSKTDILTNILGPSTIVLCESREPLTVPPVEHKLSIWTRLRRYVREEWSEAARQVLQNLASGYQSGGKRPATSP